MEAKIQYFQSPIFGEIRVTVIENKPMFVASDVAAMLGYSNRYDAINRHCKGVVKHEGVSITTNQYGKSTEQKVEISFIPIRCLPSNHALQIARSRKVPGLGM